MPFSKKLILIFVKPNPGNKNMSQYTYELLTFYREILITLDRECAEGFFVSEVKEEDGDLIFVMIYAKGNNQDDGLKEKTDEKNIDLHLK